MQTDDVSKQAAGNLAAQWIEDGMRVGLGTGSTATFFIKALAKRCQQGLNIQAVASSKESHELAVKLKIPLLDINLVTSLDMTVDGADEIDLKKQMIKGGGGALLREKIIASMSQEMVVVVSNAKVVQKLGSFPLPVEIAPFGWPGTLKRLLDCGFQGSLRGTQNTPFITDNGNYIVDIQSALYGREPDVVLSQLKSIPGVLEVGLFLDLAGRVIIGYGDGKVEVMP
jgi:ribose 5-phosphate isomerase A